MANIVFQAVPDWARIDVVLAHTGVPDNMIRRLYNEGHVRARKMDAKKTNSACVYKMQDVLDWLENEAAHPEKFKLPEVDNG